MSRAYLDHASSSPLRPEVRAAILRMLEAGLGDPGRLHAEGRTARVALEQARIEVATFFGARPREVVFTGSGTEAVNAAVHGALTRAAGRTHAVTTAVEHSAVTEAIAARTDAVTTIGVDQIGRAHV